MKKKFPTFGNFLKIILLFIVFQIPFGMPMALWPKYKMLFMLLAYVFAMSLTIWSVRRIYNRRSKLNFQVNNLSLLPFIIIITYLFFLLGNLTIAMLPEPTGKIKEFFDMLQETMKMLIENKFLGFLMLAIAAPLLEEILFRGIILKSLLKKYSPYKAIFYSALAFGIFHMNPWQFLYATILGLWLGYIYWKTKSLFYPILIHFIVNSTAFFLGLKYGNDMNNDPFEKNKDFVLYLVISISIITLLWFAYRYLEKFFVSTKKTIVLATQNPHKILEIHKILPENLKLISLKDLGFEKKLRETGETLEENALQKMRQIAIPYDVDTIADDTGLEVEALNGEPGVYSARYAGENATYEDNVQKLLEEMNDKKNRNARFKTVIAVSLGDKEYIVEGEIRGKITTEPRGKNGFGYDSIFLPDGYDKTFAEMTDEEKNRISHRANALKKLKEIFKL